MSKVKLIFGLIAGLLLTTGVAYAVCGANRSQYAYRIGGTLPGPYNCKMPRCYNTNSIGRYVIPGTSTVGHLYRSAAGAHAGLANCPAEVVWEQADPL